MSRFKILVFLLAVSIAGSVLAAAYWYFTRIVNHETLVTSEIRDIQSRKNSLPDPGVRRFDRAIELIKEGDIMNGRDALYQMVEQFPKSGRVEEAKRIIGEVNMDMLFGMAPSPLKKTYVVQPGDSLGRIANKAKTTTECLMRTNGLLSGNLQPGDKLVVFEMEFQILIDVSDKTIQLLRSKDGLTWLFKEYTAIELKLPPGVKAPSVTPMSIGSKGAWVSGKAIQSNDPRFLEADKALTVLRSNKQPAFQIRALPRAKPVNAAPPTAAPDAAAKGGKNTKKGTKNTPASNAEEEEEAPPLTGMFLSHEDVEELYTIIRNGTVVSLRR